MGAAVEGARMSGAARRKRGVGLGSRTEDVTSLFVAWFRMFGACQCPLFLDMFFTKLSSSSELTAKAPDVEFVVKQKQRGGGEWQIWRLCW